VLTVPPSDAGDLSGERGRAWPTRDQGRYDEIAAPWRPLSEPRRPEAGTARPVSAFRVALDSLAAAEHPGHACPPDPAGHPGTGGPASVDEVCKQLLAQLRKRCPGLALPTDPLPAGQPGAVVPVSADQVGVLIGASIADQVTVSASGRLPGQGAPPPPAVLWRDGIDSLLVKVADISVKLSDGVVLVIIPVMCDQLRDAAGAPATGAVVVELHVGTADRPTGMFAATPERPDGPPVVVQRWGAALTALAWRALLEAAAGIAAAAGRDADGSPLVPVALVASGQGLAVLPQARHPFDRQLPGQAVR